MLAGVMAAQEVLESVLPILRAQQHTLTYRDAHTGSQIASVNIRKKINQAIFPWLICSFNITQDSSHRPASSIPRGIA